LHGRFWNFGHDAINRDKECRRPHGSSCFVETKPSLLWFGRTTCLSAHRRRIDKEAEELGSRHVDRG
jgi:hypothetical protein